MIDEYAGIFRETSMSLIPSFWSNAAWSLKRSIRSLLLQLDRPGSRSVLGFLITTIMSLRNRQLARRFTYDQSTQAWIQWNHEGALVNRKLHWDYTYQEAVASKREDLFYRYQPKKGDMVVIVGAGTGEDVFAIAPLVGEEGRILAIEAHPKVFACLKKACQINGLRNVELLQCAVSNQSRDVYIEDHGEYLKNSILADRGTVPVQGRRLDEILDSFNYRQVDFLHINIEGAEIMALQGLQDYVTQIRHICVSCHDFRADRGDGEEMRTFKDVMEFLKEHGFVTLTRDSDPRPWIRCTVYAENTVSRLTSLSPFTSRA